MNPLEDCDTFIEEFPSLTKANSFIHQGRVIVILSKLPTGKDTPKRKVKGKHKTTYCSYDHKTKVYLKFGFTKDYLIDFIKQQDLGVLSEVDI